MTALRLSSSSMTLALTENSHLLFYRQSPTLGLSCFFMIRLRLYILGKNAPERTLCPSRCLISGPVHLDHLVKVVSTSLLPCKVTTFFFPFVTNTYFVGRYFDLSLKTLNTCILRIGELFLIILPANFGTHELFLPAIIITMMFF